MVLSALLAFVLVLVVLRDRGATITLGVAAADIDAGSRITGAQVRYVESPLVEAGLVDTFLDSEELNDAIAAGWMAATDIPAGRALTDSAFRPEPGPTVERLMSLPVPASNAAGGSIHAGDRVDVIFVASGRAEYAATDVEVIEISIPSGGLGGREGLIVTVAVDAATSLRLAAALGGDVHLVRATGSTKADAAAFASLGGSDDA